MSDEREPPEEDFEDEDGGEDAHFTSAEFHTATQKLVIGALDEMLADAKLSWKAVRPFLEAGREMARGDFEEAKVRLHTLVDDGGQWIDAREAFLGISVADRDDGEEWLAETWWISEIATADEDPERVRAIVRGLERSVALLNAWLAEKEGGAEAPPSLSQQD